MKDGKQQILFVRYLNLNLLKFIICIIKYYFFAGTNFAENNCCVDSLTMYLGVARVVSK